MKKLLLPFFLTLLFLLPHPSFAVDVTSQLKATAGEQGAGYAAAQDPRLIIAYGIKIFLSLLGLLFLAYTIYAGFIIMTARGEEEKVSEGKKILRRAVIGVIIILAAYSITLFVEKLATGNRKHQGDYIEIQDTDIDFQDSDQRHDVDRVGCPFGLNKQPDGSCGAYKNQ